ncbi:MULTISPECIES: IS110 family transposase, partial [unclassified Halomonas]
AKANQIRGLVGEYGLIAPTGIQQLRRALPLWLEDASNGLSDHFRRLLAELANDLRYLDDRVEQLTTAIEKHANTDPVARRLMTLRGIGPITASALAGVLGDGTIYQRGRDFAASLGLTPRQHSTGGRERLLGISKRGNGYLRKLLVHGARSVLRYAVTQEDGLSQWIKRLAMRKHRNVAIVALANKTARMAWAITRHQVPYDPELAAAT